jgi:hypothetical protein
MSKARDTASAPSAPSTVSATELGYVDGVTSAIQTQIDSKIGSASAINPTIVDAKGDIIAATAADTVARLAVGSNDTVLTADSTAATGLKWAAPAGGSLQEQRFTSSGTFTVPTGVTKVWATVVGAGGGGATRDGSNVVAWGGYSGAYITEQVTVTPGASITVTIGTGGGSGGGSGNASSFGALSASGGYGGSKVPISDKIALNGESGYGIGGAGATNSTGTAAAANTGAGGGAGDPGAAGGSGIVIVRWLG